MTILSGMGIIVVVIFLAIGIFCFVAALSGARHYHDEKSKRREFKRGVPELITEAKEARQAGNFDLAKEILLEARMFAVNAHNMALKAKIQEELKDVTRIFKMQKRSQELAMQSELEAQKAEIQSLQEAAKTLLAEGQLEDARTQFQLALTLTEQLHETKASVELRAAIEKIEKKLASRNELSQKLQAILDSVQKALDVGADSEVLRLYPEAESLAQRLGDASVLVPFQNRVETLRARHEEEATHQKLSQQKALLNRALTLYEEITVSKLAKLLEIDDPMELEKWLLSLADNVPIRIVGDKITITAGADISRAIDGMMDAFATWETSKVGKRE